MPKSTDELIQETADEILKAPDAPEPELTDVKDLPGLPMLPEAPAAVNFKVITARGFIMQWTLRDEDEDNLAQRASHFCSWLTDNGAIPCDFYGKPMQPASHAAPAAPASSSALPETLSSPTPLSQPANPPPAEEQAFHSFEAEELVASMHEGKTYWKVKGGHFKLYGVTIWPEVLESAGINPEELDIQKTYNLQRFNAIFITNDAGKPQKIVRLEERN